MNGINKIQSNKGPILFDHITTGGNTGVSFKHFVSQYGWQTGSDFILL